MLRGLGMDVDTGRMIDVVEALSWIRIVDKDDFYHGLRCLLVHHREDLPIFDRAFAIFWRKPVDGQIPSKVQRNGKSRRPRPLVVPPPLRLPKQGAAPQTANQPNHFDEPPIVQATLTYSDREMLRKKDFNTLTNAELRVIERMLVNFIWQLGKRRTRRFRPGTTRLFDLRRTLRQNLRFGGEILSWSRKEPKYKPRPLVILADISGSMERYTRLLLHFVYGLSRGYRQASEAFVFSTRLTRITRQLRERDVDQALRTISDHVPDWSGGTRIGEALKIFNFKWGRRVLGHGAVVLLISDGWDRGDAGVLRAEISRLQRSCHRLIWLNPLLGSQDYEPLARGMQTALPYIDDFLPVHNLASLEDLAVHLQRIEEKSPVRRQIPIQKVE